MSSPLREVDIRDEDIWHWAINIRSANEEPYTIRDINSVACHNPTPFSPPHCDKPVGLMMPQETTGPTTSPAEPYYVRGPEPHSHYDDQRVDNPPMAAALFSPPSQHHATASDLPPESVSRIVEILSGYEMAIFKEDAQDYNWKKWHLYLSRGELARCSLTCKYWAKILRPGLFRILHLNSVEDGRLFHAFVQSPAVSNLNIAQYVYQLDLEYSIFDPPWLHLVLISVLSPGRPTNINLSFLGSRGNLADSSDTSSIRLRSIHQSLPHPLPQSISFLWLLKLKDLAFANFADLAAIIHSAPLSSTGLHIHLIFQGVRVTDKEATILTSPFQRAILDYGVALEIKDCETPWLFLRAFIPTRPPGRIVRSREVPFMQPPALLAFEEIIYTMMQMCEICSKPASQTDSSNSETDLHMDTHTCNLGYEIRAPRCHNRLSSSHSSHRNAAHVLCANRCPNTALERITTDILEGGAMVSLAFNVKPGQCDAAEAVPWRKIDDISSTLVPDLQFIDIRLYGVGRISERLVEVVRREMP